MDSFEDLTVIELKEELKKRKAKQSGRKSELVQRLNFYVKNVNNEETYDNGGYKMVTPQPDQYRDVHKDALTENLKTYTLPELRLRAYLQRSDTTLDELKIKDLYRDRFIRCMRIATCTPSQSNKENQLPTTDTGVKLVYFNSAVWAEYNTTTWYRVDIAIAPNGVIHECDCECPVGTGPKGHCKHVTVTLHGIVQFFETTEVRTEVTCTQVLQKFHKTKTHKGSPLKASSIGTRRGEQRNSLVFDPRPIHYRQRAAFPMEFRSTCLNYEGAAKMPILQLFGPANIKAVAHDHDYMKETPEEHFLRKSKITQINPAEAEELEQNTKDQRSSRYWADQRTLRLTSSNFGRLCKATQRTDKVKLAASLTVHKTINVPAILHGIEYEHLALELLYANHHIATSPCGLCVSLSHPFLAASPDGIVTDGETLVEVKCPYSAKDEKITPSTVGYLVQSADGQLELDNHHNYYYQIQGQMFCTGKQKCLLVVYTHQDLQLVPVQRDESFIEQMVDNLTEFFNNYFRQAVIEAQFYKCCRL